MKVVHTLANIHTHTRTPFLFVSLRSTLMEEMQPTGWIWDCADKDSCATARPMDLD